MHRRQPVLGESCGRIHELLATDDDIALEQHRRAVGPEEQLRAQRGSPATLRLEGVVVLVDQPELEGCRGAKHALRLGRVLNARQLNDNPIEALALDHRLGDAELVDAVAQRGDVE